MSTGVGPDGSEHLLIVRETLLDLQSPQSCLAAPRIRVRDRDDLGLVEPLPDGVESVAIVPAPRMPDDRDTQCGFGGGDS